MTRGSQARRLVLVLALALLPATASQAQETIETEGTADFRNPPVLSNGIYEDEIVTGEAVWYAVIYRNDKPYRIAVDLVDSDVDEDEELALEAMFIGPTLGSVASGRVLEGSASYNGGTTNLWYIQVNLATDGRLGVEHTLRLDISGVQTTRISPCDALPDCDLDTRLAEINAEIMDLEESLSELGNSDAEEAVRDEISELEQRKATAESELAASQSAIAAACDPEPDCDSVPVTEPTTPVWAIAVGAVILIGGGAFLITGIRGRA